MVNSSEQFFFIRDVMVSDFNTDINSDEAIKDGWMVGAMKVPSPNFNSRPNDCPFTLLVIHNISLPPGQFGNGYIDKFFTNQLDSTLDPYFEEIAELQVSSHLLIDRKGVLTQYVSFNDRAWHAGASCYQGEENCNDYSIGIELEGTDTAPYTDEQYHALANTTKILADAYSSFSTDHITGHMDIAPSRKTDPGESFDWPYYRQLLSDLL